MRTAITCLLLAMLFAPSAPAADDKAAPTKVKRVDVAEFDKLRANTNFILLDVRSAAEFEKGHIPGAINIDVNSLSFSNKVHALGKSKTCLVNCAVGMRSARACQKMESMGFTTLYDLAPGFDGWKKAGKPVEKQSAPNASARESQTTETPAHGQFTTEMISARRRHSCR